MKNIFIDTNVLLSFFHFTSDDLVELEKLAAFIRQDELKFLLPEQVVVEFQRNRERTIADSLGRLRAQKLNLQFPQLSKNYPEYAQLRQAQQEYARLHAELIAQIEVDVSGEALLADTVITSLFDLAARIPTTEDLVAKARFRMEIGNPPGKKGSFGDAIIWEALLDSAPQHEDLSFVSNDRDFFSEIEGEKLDPFLVREWAARKHSELSAYSRISEFLRPNFPEIELISEDEKAELISNLGTSGSFRTTHRLVSELSAYDRFTDTEINQIAEAAVSNDQVSWIINDEDVRQFLESIIKPREQAVDYRLLTELNRLMGEEVFKAIPF